jgi:hypothetical protein
MSSMGFYKRLENRLRIVWCKQHEGNTPAQGFHGVKLHNTLVVYVLMRPQPIIPSSCTSKEAGLRLLDHAAFFHMEVIRLATLLIAFGIAWGLFGLSLLLHGLFGPVRIKATCPAYPVSQLRIAGARWTSPRLR